MMILRAKKLFAALMHPLFDLSQPIHYLYLLLFPFIVLAILASRGAMPRSAGAALQIMFPRDIYGRRSAIFDYKMFLVWVAFAAFFPWRIFTWLQIHCSQIVSHSMAGVLAAHAQHPTPIVKILFIGLCFLLTDLAWYVSHVALHRIPVLWEFHSVHHSAENLNVVTTFRESPVDPIVTFAFISLFLGLFEGLYDGIYHIHSSSELTLIPLYFYVPFAWFNLFKHYHVPMSFGPFLSRIIYSPDLHHLHHSTQSAHMNRNFGHLLSIWDWLFGTLVAPTEFGKLAYGLSYGNPGRPEAEYDSIPDGLLKPFLGAMRVLTRNGTRAATRDRPGHAQGR